MAKHYRGDLLYSPEDDVHFPTLTVDETLRFAAKMRAPRKRLEGMTRKSYMRTMTDILETLFGLRHAVKTPIGDNRIRGVSGGEKKRK
jgi:ATP-binding cassette subfamily G (WHITE) protein 2 (SNQ2)